MIPSAARDERRPGERRASVEPGPQQVFVLPGQVRVASMPTNFTTVLGSCVAVCLFDRETSIGGINHFLLPGGPGAAVDEPLRWGEPAIEALVAAVLRAGSRLAALEAKVFGGAQIAPAGVLPHQRIGERNIETAVSELARRRIPVVALAVGGASGRKVVFESHTGLVWMRELASGAA